MIKETTDRVRYIQYLSVVVLFLVAGGLIGSATYVSFIPQNTRTILKAGMAGISLIAWLGASK